MTSTDRGHDPWPRQSVFGAVGQIVHLFSHKISHLATGVGRTFD